jgi:hypothetical protein
MVLDRDEIRESLTDTEIDILIALNDKIMEGRERKKFLMIESEDLADILEEAGL